MEKRNKCNFKILSLFEKKKVAEKGNWHLIIGFGSWMYTIIFSFIFAASKENVAELISAYIASYLSCIP